VSAAAAALAFCAFLRWLWVSLGFTILMLEKMGNQMLIKLQWKMNLVWFQ
jgi:hypothetical protein